MNFACDVEVAEIKVRLLEVSLSLTTCLPFCSTGSPNPARSDHQQVLDWSKGFILTFWGPEGLLINFQPVYRYISWLILHQPWHLVTTPLVLSWFMPSWDHSCPVNFISCLVFIQIRFFVPIQKTNKFDMDRNWVWIVWVWAQIDWVQNGVGYKMIGYLAFRWKFHMT